MEKATGVEVARSHANDFAKEYQRSCVCGGLPVSDLNIESHPTSLIRAVRHAVWQLGGLFERIYQRPPNPKNLFPMIGNLR